MKWIASLLFVAVLALALFSHAPAPKVALKGGPVVTPTVVPSATPVSA